MLLGSYIQESLRCSHIFPQLPWEPTKRHVHRRPNLNSRPYTDQLRTQTQRLEKVLSACRQRFSCKSCGQQMSTVYRGKACRMGLFANCKLVLPIVFIAAFFFGLSYPILKIWLNQPNKELHWRPSVAPLWLKLLLQVGDSTEPQLGQDTRRRAPDVVRGRGVMLKGPCFRGDTSL